MCLPSHNPLLPPVPPRDHFLHLPCKAMRIKVSPCLQSQQTVCMSNKLILSFLPPFSQRSLCLLSPFDLPLALLCCVKLSLVIGCTGLLHCMVQEAQETCSWVFEKQFVCQSVINPKLNSGNNQDVKFLSTRSFCTFSLEKKMQNSELHNLLTPWDFLKIDWTLNITLSWIEAWIRGSSRLSSSVILRFNSVQTLPILLCKCVFFDEHLDPLKLHHNLSYFLFVKMHCKFHWMPLLFYSLKFVVNLGGQLCQEFCQVLKSFRNREFGMNFHFFSIFAPIPRLRALVLWNGFVQFNNGQCMTT